MSSVATSIPPPRAPSPAPPAPSALGRVLALDRLRGLALVAMVVHHLTDWLTGDARAVLPGWSSFAVTDVAAPAFFVAAGASAALFVAARRRKGMSRPRVAAEVVRRYGLLVPIGLAFDWLLWRHPTMFGVIEALGFTVVAGAAVAIAVGPRLLPMVAAGMVVGGMLAEWAVSGAGGWWADEFVAGKFPAITYTGFVLVGMAAVRTGRFADRRWGLTAAAVATAGVVVLLALGITPDRYPGGPAFVVPGLAGTALVYAVAQCGWPDRLARVDRLVQAASTAPASRGRCRGRWRCRSRWSRRCCWRSWRRTCRGPPGRCAPVAGGGRTCRPASRTLTSRCRRSRPVLGLAK